jgi:hypothetical protein
MKIPPAKTQESKMATKKPTLLQVHEVNPVHQAIVFDSADHAEDIVAELNELKVGKFSVVKKDGTITYEKNGSTYTISPNVAIIVPAGKNEATTVPLSVFNSQFATVADASDFDARLTKLENRKTTTTAKASETTTKKTATATKPDEPAEGTEVVDTAKS